MMLLEIGLLLVLIVVNGVLSMSETAVVTARRSRLAHRREQGDDGAAAATALKEQPTRFLSAVQIGITLVGIISGALGGSRLARHLEGPLAQIDWLAPHADTVALVLTVAGVTYLSLIIGELVPKRIALADPERVASRIAGPMQRLAAIATPLVVVLTASTNAVARLIGLSDRGETEVTEGEIRRMISRGARAGVVHAAEEDILERVFYLGDRRVDAVMTSRPDVAWISPDASPDAIRDALASAPGAPLLVCEGALDRVLGVVSPADLLVRCLSGEAPDVRRVTRDAREVPASTPVLELLQEFQQPGASLAVVRDEEGRLAGVVTFDDLLRDLVEYMPRRVGPSGADVVYQDDGTWLLDGGVPLRAVERALGRKILPHGAARGTRTLHALVVEHVGRPPAVGDRLRLAGYRFEVVDIDGDQVDRVRVTRDTADGDPAS